MQWQYFFSIQFFVLVESNRLYWQRFLRVIFILALGKYPAPGKLPPGKLTTESCSSEILVPESCPTQNPPLPWNVFVNFFLSLFIIFLWKFSFVSKICFYSIYFLIIKSNFFILYFSIIFFLFMYFRFSSMT